MYLLSLVFFFLQPPKPNHPVGSACSRLPWLAAPPPPYHTLQCWPVPPSIPHASYYSPATSAPTRTRARTSQPSYSPPPTTGPAHLQRLLFVPSEASPSSSALRPWFARRARCAALLRCQRRQQPRGIRRLLYMERMTVGTHQRHGSTQASASILQAQKYGSS